MVLVSEVCQCKSTSLALMQARVWDLGSLGPCAQLFFQRNGPPFSSSFFLNAGLLLKSSPA
jgi:hypothetical protein